MFAPRILAAIVLFTSLADLGLGQAADPVFESGNTKKLACRILSRKKTDFVYRVEVKNKGRLTAEPLEFTFTPRHKAKKKDAVQVRRRFMAPNFGRAGRAVRAGRKLVYYVIAPWGRKAPKDWRVAVTAASFFRGEGVVECPVALSDRRTKKVHDAVVDTTIDQVTIRMENRLDFPVEFMLRVNDDKSGKTHRLYLDRLEPRQVARWGDESHRVEEFRRPREFAGVPSGTAHEITVVDWSVLRDDGATEAAEILRPIYATWYRRTDDFRFAGRMHYRMRAVLNGESRPPRRGTLRFEADASGIPRAIGDEAFHFTEQELIGRAVGEAYHAVVRPGWEELASETTISMIAIEPASVAIDVPNGQPHPLGFRVLEVGNDRLTGTRRFSETTSDFSRWTTREIVAGQWGLTKRVDLWRVGEEDREARRVAIEWKKTRDGHVMPRRVTIEEHGPFDPGSEWARIELDLEYDAIVSTKEKTATSSASPNDGSPPPSKSPDALVPTGPVADRLRAAWESTYRYPPESVDLRGRVAVEHPGTDGIWHGIRPVVADFDWKGYSGRAETMTTPFREARYIVKSKAPASDRRAVEKILVARSTIWTRQDFAGRRAFDEEFAGTTLRADRKRRGDIIIVGGKLRRVRIRKGRVTRIELRDGTRRDLYSTRIGKHDVVTRIVNRHDGGRNELKATYRKIAKGRLMPVHIELVGWFGDDWGPEVYTYDRIEIVRSSNESTQKK